MLIRIQIPIRNTGGQPPSPPPLVGKHPVGLLPEVIQGNEEARANVHVNQRETRPRDLEKKKPIPRETLIQAPKEQPDLL
jgi:hypothetical protein